MPRALIFLTFFLPFTLFQSAVAIVGTLAGLGPSFAHGCARSWSRWGLRMAGVRVEVEGEERIPEGPVIFMGNHQGNFDILSLTVAIPRRFSWLAKEELFRVPFFGGAMRRAGYISIDRSDGRRALRSIEEAARTIRSGVSVVIFPEGTRTTDGNLLPFRKGGFLLAAKAGVPVVPFTINGSMNVNPRNRLELYPAPISITFGDPIPTSGEGEFRRAELPERVRGAISARLESYR
jgi:1-acyl-sn-glycerol-3-phosphate acyltransferase